MAIETEKTKKPQPFSEYIKNTADQKSRIPFDRVLALVKHKRQALDVGAGGLRASRVLAKHFAHVTAIDSAPAARINAGKVLKKEKDLSNIRFRAESMDMFYFKPNTYDLIVAEYSLPFAGQHLDDVMQRMLASLKPGGVFAGDLFGNRHDWSKDESKAFRTRAEAEAYFTGFELKEFKEVTPESPGVKPDATHRHLFHIIAVKK